MKTRSYFQMPLKIWAIMLTFGALSWLPSAALAQDTTRPTTPGGVSIVNATYDGTNLTVSVSWSASTDASGIFGYIVKHGGSTAAGPADFVQMGTPTASPFTYTIIPNPDDIGPDPDDVIPGIGVFGFVAAVTAVDNSPNRNQSLNPGFGWWTFWVPPTGDVTPPVIPSPWNPTAVKGPADTHTQITVSWAAATDAESAVTYELSRDGGAFFAAGASTSYSDTGRTPGATYAYRVRAVSTGGTSAPSNSVSATTDNLPDTTRPSNITATPTTNITGPVGGPYTITVNWPAATDNIAVTGYKISVDGNDANPSTSATNSFPHTGIPVSTTHTYKVKAVDAAGNESLNWSPQVSATTDAGPDTTRPSDVSGTPVATITGNGPYTITVTWTAATDNVGVTGYKVSVDGNDANPSTVAAATFSTNNVPYSTTHTYKVKAVDAAGNESLNWSNQVSATTQDAPPPDTTPPTTPTGVSLSNVSYDGILLHVTVSWNPSTDASGIFGYIVKHGGGTAQFPSDTVQVGTPIAPPFTYTITPNPADIGLGFAVSVFAVDNSANRNRSAQDGLAFQDWPDAGGDPTPPSNVTATPTIAVTGAGPYTVTVTWLAATDNVLVTGYKIAVDGNEGSPATSVGPSYAQNNIPASTTKRYKVKAVDAAGNESVSWSPEAQVTTGTPGDPTEPSNVGGTPQANITGAGPYTITVTWNAATDNVGIAGYKIAVNGDETEANLITTNGTGRSYPDPNVPSSTTKRYKVKAFDAAGNRSAQWSNEVSATTPAPPVGAPNPPENCRVSSHTDHVIDIAWNAPSTGAGAVTNYAVLRNGSVIATVSSATLTYHDTRRRDQTAYTYTVRSINSQGTQSVDSNSISVTTDDDTTPPGAPGGFRFGN